MCIRDSLSKVLELYVVRHARKTIHLKQNQYGGEPGVSTTHMLVDVWSRLTEELEDNRAASVITAIDYSTAFNRSESGPCLHALSRKGAGRGLLKIIGSFLHARRMTVRIGEAVSEILAGQCRSPTRLRTRLVLLQCGD